MKILLIFTFFLTYTYTKSIPICDQFAVEQVMPICPVDFFSAPHCTMDSRGCQTCYQMCVYNPPQEA